MSIQDQLIRLQSAKASLAAAISGKGVTVPETAKLDAYGGLVDQISTSGGGSGVRTCRLVIGTSAAGWTQSDCDVLCTGQGDDDAINNAIQQVGSMGGGEIVLLSGTYIVSTPIMVQSPNISLRGNGSSTVIQRGYSGSAVGVVNITGDNCGIAACVIDSNLTDTAGYDIELYIGSQNCTVKYCNVINVKGDATPVLIEGDSAIIAYNNTHAEKGIYAKGDAPMIIGNRCMASSLNAIDLSNESTGGIIMGNNCDGSSNGISASSCHNIIAYGNQCNGCITSGIVFAGVDNSIIAHNICDQSEVSIVLENSDDISVLGNRCKDFGVAGIVIAGDNCHVSNNVCLRGNGNPSDYSADQHTIWFMEGYKTVIINNSILGKDVTNNAEVSANTVVNNYTFTQSSGGGTI
ncbi:NosD domain-containing protein [Solibaculum mannosilyticum]|uniref:Periplasmic copper-binding protein NosD beta helix domain-containing protein n=1 Tax=Solibaculum mannosilyticum TaxID=2780922 RepID=A0A7I8D7N9_9FIRM|nr:right-handed parallel beta-helix repeat-containing protein [Solibaculum mannosilyticum]BCI60654.1 hypothetical protein C12CBH8_12930 [Solibaculum mannosilyticum]